MSAKLILALPSKGRLMEQCADMLAQGRARASRRPGSARGYKGEIAGLPGVEVNFVSSSEIAQFLKSGAAHLGITGEDLIRETIADCRRARRASCGRCGFGHADVVVAVPAVLDRRAPHGRPGGDGARATAACTAAACASPPST